MGNINIGLDTQKRAAEKDLVFLETFQNRGAVEENGGTLVGSPTIDETITLNGSTDFVRYDNTGQIFNNANGSIRFKIRPIDGQGVGSQYIISQYAGTSNQRAWGLRIDTAGKLTFLTSSDGSAISSFGTSDSIFANGEATEFTDVVFTFGSGVGKFYINGSLVTAIGTIETSFFRTSASLSVGATSDGAAFTNAEIDFAYIFDGVELSAAEILAYYNNTMWTYDQHCVLALPMNLRDHKPEALEIDAGLIDGDMEAADVSAWTAVNAAALSKQTSDLTNSQRCLRITRSNTGYAQQNILTNTKTYKITGYCRSDGVSIPTILLGSNTVFTGTNSTDWQEFNAIGNTDNTGFNIGKTVAGSFAEFDNVTVTEINSYTKDRSGQGNDAIFGGGLPANYPTFSDGRYTFDNSYDYMLSSALNIAANQTNELTVMVHVNVLAANLNPIISSYDFGANERSWAIRPNSINKNYIVVVSEDGTLGSKYKEYRSSLTPANGNDNIFGFTFADNTLKLFINGNEDNNVTKTVDQNVASIFYSNTTPISINCFLNNGSVVNNLGMQMMSVFIYSTALNPTQIRDLFYRIEAIESQGRAGQ
jgi:hypothetical protein